MEKIYREKNINSHMGLSPTKETRNKISNSLKNHEISDETRNKISNSVKELWLNENFRINMTNKLKGKIPWNKGLKNVQNHSEATKIKMSETKKLQFATNPELAKRISKMNTGYKQTPEHIANKRASRIANKEALLN